MGEKGHTSNEQPRLALTWRWAITGLLAIVSIAVVAAGVRLLQPEPLAVTYAGPQGSAGAAAFIRLEFSAAMDRESVTGRLSFEPALKGSVEWWNDGTLIYRPAEKMAEGARYTVTLEAGALSANGQLLDEPLTFAFEVRGPRLAYIAPANARPENLWLIDPDDPDQAAQITFSTSGVYNFAVSPDGGRIAYAERSADSGGIEIMLLTLDTGATEQVTSCGGSECTGPVWRPDGAMLAFERRDKTPDSSPAVWIADLRPETPDVHALLDTTDTTVYAPAWSPDGALLAVYNETSLGLSIIDMQAGAEAAFVPTQHAGPGRFSPDSRRIAFADLVLAPTSARTHFHLFDIATQEITLLNTPEAPLDDDHALWTADGDLLLVSRQYLDDRYTPGRQLYRVAPETGDAKPLLVDAKFYHGYFELAPSGSTLAVQRLPQGSGPSTTAQVLPEIWLFSMDDGALTKVAADAFLPHWVP